MGTATPTFHHRPPPTYTLPYLFGAFANSLCQQNCKAIDSGPSCTTGAMAALCTTLHRPAPPQLALPLSNPSTWLEAGTFAYDDRKQRGTRESRVSLTIIAWNYNAAMLQSRRVAEPLVLPCRRVGGSTVAPTRHHNQAKKKKYNAPKLGGGTRISLTHSWLNNKAKLCGQLRLYTFFKIRILESFSKHLFQN